MRYNIDSSGVLELIAEDEQEYEELYEWSENNLNHYNINIENGALDD